MFRENRTRIAAVATALLTIAVAAALAQTRNPSAGAVAQPSTAATAEAAAAGPRAFQRLGCVKCHSFRGVGNPDLPLDDVVQRMDRATIHDWASGAGAAQSRQSVTLARRKARTATAPDFESLIDYLASGTPGNRQPGP